MYCDCTCGMVDECGVCEGPGAIYECGWMVYQNVGMVLCDLSDCPDQPLENTNNMD